ncbi:thiamine phosphate synthase [Lysobacter humi (ex Lee et al. 2017)]
MPPATPWPQRGLYAITPDEPDTGRLVARVDAVLDAGVAWLQYRNKPASDVLRAEQSRALLARCRAHGVPLIVNDDVELAAAIGADGVHLGGDDGDVADARARLGANALIGASCYDALDRAHDAVARGASYVAFGAFHPSPTKPGARRADRALLADSAGLGVPRVAIGGITPAHAPALVQAGADLIAVISGVFDAPEPRVAVRTYLDAFQELPA